MHSATVPTLYDGIIKKYRHSSCVDLHTPVDIRTPRGEACPRDTGGIGYLILAIVVHVLRDAGYLLATVWAFLVLFDVLDLLAKEERTARALPRTVRYCHSLKGTITVQTNEVLYCIGISLRSYPPRHALSAMQPIVSHEYGLSLIHI